uniref:F-box and leucine rich repeat protein 6 n=1 Tax=Suricata suricatta TaxID=37032 RepID=A0A673VIK5_SURSU
RSLGQGDRYACTGFPGGVHSRGQLPGGGRAPNAQAVADLQFPDDSHLGCAAGQLLPPAPGPGARALLQVLRLLNLVWLPKPSGRAATPGPGFPGLQELCLAGSTCSFVSNDALARLLHGSPSLRLLDLRGCARVTPAGLHGLPCQDLEQLYLGLYGTSDRLTLAKEGSYLLTQKWCHALRELDLSGQGFSEKDLEQALAAFSVMPAGSPPALCSLNLRGTRVTPSTVSSVISSCPGLLYLNLESCRCLPRGLKRAYRGQEEVQGCLEQLLTSLPSSG